MQIIVNMIDDAVTTRGDDVRASTERADDAASRLSAADRRHANASMQRGAAWR